MDIPNNIAKMLLPMAAKRVNKPINNSKPNELSHKVAATAKKGAVDGGIKLIVCAVALIKWGKSPQLTCGWPGLPIKPNLSETKNK